MRTAIRKAKEGFTLIELMIVVAIVGVLAVLAIYGVRRYIANAKTAEARNNLGQIAKDASSAYNREKIATATVLAPGTSAALQVQMCASATPVPASKVGIQGAKYQSGTSEWNTGDAVTGWTCLKFQIQDPQYYMYNYTATNPTGQNAAFNATANGDLNGDGVLSTFSIGGSLVSNTVNVAPTVAEVNPEE